MKYDCGTRPVDSVALFFKSLTNKPFANKCHGIYAINKGVYHLLNLTKLNLT